MQAALPVRTSMHCQIWVDQRPGTMTCELAHLLAVLVCAVTVRWAMKSTNLDVARRLVYVVQKLPSTRRRGLHSHAPTLKFPCIAHVPLYERHDKTLRAEHLQPVRRMVDLELDQSTGLLRVKILIAGNRGARNA
ncbi:hypothetical protein L226DRAFT_179271 [Lentinus tigrinus ALCF2SS1-7]|uniref:Uncharacterized protein n=1 Tax=Lentinus tigrinus ALCF2SS1-6 TaxID=1328759 RepID=A0A5C2SR48_9APHY|nr:hypothetical protein L227DRAFT_121197 [Lentinus tigrinus ALCF2SS1-6]RPD79749.1 hypothetical protein L226DRAFT_179271 [Lentinus tigrinus ALCF2SS1-7]